MAGAVWLEMKPAGMYTARMGRVNKMCCLWVRLACVAVLGWGVGFLLYPAAGWAQDMAPMPFDKPLKTDTATFMEYDPPVQPNPSGPKFRVIVTCSYYPRFVVEVRHFDDEEGAAIFTILVKNGIGPPCEDPEVSNAKAVADAGGWLMGVKNDLVITVAPDTFDGGIGFTIVRPLDHKVVLSDAVQVDDKMEPLLTSIRESKAGVEVRYNRIFAGSCSVVARGEACVDMFVKQTGMGKRAFAECATSYRHLEERFVRWRCTKSGRFDNGCFTSGLTPAAEREWNEDPTAIAYGVKVFIPANETAVQFVPYSASLSSAKDRTQAIVQLPTAGSLTGCFPGD